MATVTGLTAARMIEIEAASVVSGAVDGTSGDLMLTTHDGTISNAGHVSGDPGPTGAAGATGNPGSGVGPNLLGEVVMTSNSQDIAGTGSTDWNGFTRTVTVGSKPIIIYINCHVQGSSNTSIVVGVIQDGSIISCAWNTPLAGATGVAFLVAGQSSVLNPGAGTHTFKVQLRATVSGGTIKGVADTNFRASMKIVEIG